MARNWWIRFSVLAVIITVALLAIVPSVTNSDPKKWVISKKVNLGLDLQGGLYMVLGIDFNKVYRDEILVSVKKAQTYLQQEALPVTLGDLDVSDPRDPKQTLIIEGDVEKTTTKLNEYFGYSMRLVGDEGNKVTYGLSRDYLREMETTAVTRSIEVIRNRID